LTKPDDALFPRAPEATLGRIAVLWIVIVAAAAWL